MKWAHTFTIAVCLVGINSSGPLSAQEADAGADRATLEEVIVTAQKIEESILDVSISISAFSGDRLAKSGIENILDLANFTPGLSVEPSRAGGGNLYIRGIGTSLLGAGVDPNVALYEDDLG